jgi:hypothetical protein
MNYNSHNVLWIKLILIIYTDDTIITGPNEKEIDLAIADIFSKFSITGCILKDERMTQLK